MSTHTHQPHTNQPGISEGGEDALRHRTVGKRHSVCKITHSLYTGRQVLLLTLFIPFARLLTLFIPDARYYVLTLFIPFARLLTLFIPDASREAEKKNPLAALLELAGRDETEARANMDKVMDQMLPSLKAFAFDHVMTLKKNFEKVKKLDDGREVNTKFSSFELKYGLNVGGIQDFMKGLGHRIGLPHANILEGMTEEHCNMPNSNHEFESANYKIKTTAKIEWDVVQSGNYPSQKEYKAASDKHARRLRLLPELKSLPLVKPDKNGENGLIEAEIMAIVLYTGYA